ncbi:MAG: flagellar biosynthesis anti-sigma factor FlgM [Tepidiformaceae bacterium]
MPPSRKPARPTPAARGAPLGGSGRPLTPLPFITPAERARRIRALRKSIADGTYRPDSDEIARQLIEQGF